MALHLGGCHSSIRHLLILSTGCKPRAIDAPVPCAFHFLPAFLLALLNILRQACRIRCCWSSFYWGCRLYLLSSFNRWTTLRSSSLDHRSVLLVSGASWVIYSFFTLLLQRAVWEISTYIILEDFFFSPPFSFFASQTGGLFFKPLIEGCLCHCSSLLWYLFHCFSITLIRSFCDIRFLYQPQWYRRLCAFISAINFFSRDFWIWPYSFLSDVLLLTKPYHLISKSSSISQ